MATTELQKMIGGRTFQFGMLPADKAFFVLGKLLRNLGEPLSKAVTAKATKGAKTVELGMQLVGLFASNIHLDEVKEAIDELLTVTICLDQKGGGRCTMNGTFTGRLLECFQVTVEAFKVNFADFLAALPSLSKEDEETTSSQSGPPT